LNSCFISQREEQQLFGDALARLRGVDLTRLAVEYVMFELRVRVRV
jgi:hypothetical protein